MPTLANKHHQTANNIINNVPFTWNTPQFKENFPAISTIPPCEVANRSLYY